MAPQTDIPLEAFNAGELSPRASGRLTLPTYKSSSNKIVNLIPTTVGNLERRPGTEFVSKATGAPGGDSTVYTSDGSWMIPFYVSNGSSYVLELSDYKMRFYRDGGILLHSRANFAEAQINTTAKQFEIKGHGLKHGQLVVLRGNPGATVPTGLAFDTTYQVVLPEALESIDPVDATGLYKVHSTGINLFNVEVEMGPYTVKHHDNNDSEESLPLWVSAVAITGGGSLPDNTECRFATTKGGASLTPTTTSKKQNVIIPMTDALVNTFRLATPQTPLSRDEDIKNDVIQIDSTGSGGGWIEVLNDDPVEIDTPWTYDEVRELQWTSDADTMFFFPGSTVHPPFQLLRYGPSAFVLERLLLTAGPYGPTAPLGEEVTIVGTIDGSTITKNSFVKLTSDTNQFTAADIGRPFRKQFSVDGDELKYLEGIIEQTETESFRFEFYEYVSLSSTNSIIDFGGSINLSDNDLIWILPNRDSTKGLPPELARKTPYFVQETGGGQFVSLYLAKDSIDRVIFSDETGGLRIIVAEAECVLDDGNAATAHSFTEGLECSIWVDGIAPHGIDAGYTYKVVPSGTNTFRFQRLDGTEVPIAAVGSGKFWISAPQSAVTECRLRIIRDPIIPGSSQGATHRWRIGAWNQRDGWPSACTIHRELLLAGGTDLFPMTVWGSQLGILRDFSPDSRTGSSAIPDDQDRTITEASGWSYVLDNENTERILWMHPSTIVVVGTAGPIHTIDGLTPSTIEAALMTSRGASTVRPVVSDAQIIWGSSKHQHLFSAGFQEQRAGFVPDDITKTADHLFTRNNKLIQMTLQEEPWSAIWCAREDGQLLSCTYDQEQGVQAWARHKIGGTHSIAPFDFKTRFNTLQMRDWAAVKSVAVIPSTDGTQFELWMVTERHAANKTGTTDIYRSIEKMSARMDLDALQEDAMFVDCAAPATDLVADASTFTLTQDVLKEQDLDSWIDGTNTGTLTSDSNGLVTLGSDAEYKIIVGMPYRWEWESISIEALVQDIPTFKGNRSEIVRVFLGLINSLGITIHGPGISANEIDFRTREMPLDAGPLMFTGFFPIRAFPGGPADTNIIQMEGLGPEPFTMTNLIARLSLHDVSQS